MKSSVLLIIQKFYKHDLHFFIVRLVFILFMKRISSIPLPSQTSTMSSSIFSGHVDNSMHNISNINPNNDPSESIVWNNCKNIARYIPIKLAEDREREEDLSNEWKYYALDEMDKWSHMDLTYSVHEYWTQFSEKETDDAISRAFAEWSAVTPLTFKQLINDAKTADIKIKFVDSITVERRRGHWIHSEALIEISTKIEWAIDSIPGVNLVLVLTHEIGHALGLDHSDVNTAIMHASFPDENMLHFELDQDDIDGIQKFYGKNPHGDPGPRKMPRPFSPGPEAYRDSIYDDRQKIWVMYVYLESIKDYVLHYHDGESWVPFP